MRGELLSAANAFKILSTGIRQSLQESSDSTIDHIKRVVDQTSDTYSKSVEGLAEIGKTHVAELEQHHVAMRKGAQRIAAAVDRLAERLETVKLPTENLTTQLDVLTVAVKATTTGISESLLSIETQLKAIEKLLADSQSHISKYAEHLKVLEVGVNAVSQKTEDISTALEKLAKAAAATSENSLQLQGDHLKTQKELSQELQTSINQTLLAIRDQRTRLEENVKASDEIVTKVQDSFVGLVRNIISELNT